MKRAGGPLVVGTYLVWKRGPIFVRFLASALGVVGAGLVAARLLEPLSLRGTLAGLAILAVGTGTALWGVWRRARTAVHARVGPRGLSLEPVRGGDAYSWRWPEVRLVRSRDDDGGTLSLIAPRTGMLLLSHDGTAPLEQLVQAIRAHGGTVEEELS